MKTTVTSQQIGHFAQFGWIEFEHFLSAEECQKMHQAVQETVSHRLNSDKLNRFGMDKLYSAGRDCWRDSPLLKTLFISNRFASIAASLTNKKTLLLACDQWIPAGKTFDPLRLTEQFSFQNLVCGCSIELQDGHARFFMPERLMLFTPAQILIAYGGTNTVYVFNPADPCNGHLKHLGYSFNDRLNSRLNPICRI
jgi:hypothetical protein